MISGTRARSGAKKTYSSPKLTKYGEVRTLTQTGTLPGMENPGSMMNQRPSSRHIKEDIVEIGRHPLGIGLYLFDYKPEFRDLYGHARQFGAMADEVEAVMPEAVFMHPGGYKMVDYAMLGIWHCAR